MMEATTVGNLEDPKTTQFEHPEEQSKGVLCMNNKIKINGQ